MNWSLTPMLRSWGQQPVYSLLNLFDLMMFQWFESGKEAENQRRSRLRSLHWNSELRGMSFSDQKYWKIYGLFVEIDWGLTVGWCFVSLQQRVKVKEEEVCREDSSDRWWKKRWESPLLKVSNFVFFFFCFLQIFFFGEILYLLGLKKEEACVYIHSVETIRN